MIDLDGFILGLDDFIKEYSSGFLINKTTLNTELSITTNCAIERTMAIVANKYVNNYLLRTTNLKFSADELQISLNEIIDNVDDLIADVGYEVNKDSWKNCYVDGYFEYEYDNEIHNLFIEYKMESKFTFAKLATDFLKYKLYTHFSNIDTSFLYIIFEKNENYPSVLNSNLDNFVIIEKYINNEIPLSKCYFHSPGFRSELTPDCTTARELRIALELLTKIDKDCELLEDFEEFDTYSEFDKIFIDQISTFNTNVFDARILKENYAYLMNVFDISLENGLFNDFNHIINFTENSFDRDELEKFVHDACNYKTNLINKLVEDDKLIAITKGFNVGIEVSLYIIMIVNYFVKKHKINTEKTPFFYDKKTKVNGVVEIIKVSEKIQPEVFEKLDHNYNINKLRKDFDRAIFGLLYFIKMTYQLIYDIDEHNNVKSISDKKRNLKIITNIQTNIKNLNKIYKGIGKVSIENYKEDINNICCKLITKVQTNR